MTGTVLSLGRHQWSKLGFKINMALWSLFLIYCLFSIWPQELYSVNKHLPNVYSLLRTVGSNKHIQRQIPAYSGKIGSSWDSWNGKIKCDIREWLTLGALKFRTRGHLCGLEKLGEWRRYNEIGEKVEIACIFFIILRI